MTYNATNASVQDAQPIYLFRFTQGASVWTYTSADTSYTHLAEEYLPSSLQFPAIKQSQDLSKNSIKIKFPRNDLFALSHLSYAGDIVTGLTVFRVHTTDGDSEAKVVWKGRVGSTALKGEEVEISCETIYVSIQRTGLRAQSSKNCRHTVYRGGCGLNIADFESAATITAYSGRTFTCPEAALQTNGYYTGGSIRDHLGLRYLIISHVGTTLVLSRRPIDLQNRIDETGYGLSYGSSYGGIRIYIAPGCDQLRSTCINVFNNGINYGGLPWIPRRNPMDGQSIK